MILFDTDIIIDYLRGVGAAVRFLEAQESAVALSVITAAELYAGCRNSDEASRLGAFLLRFQLVPLSPEAAALGGSLRAQFGKSHGTGLADALIAGTVILGNYRFATRNRKHYPMVKDFIRIPGA